jgi:hypothetical protein
MLVQNDPTDENGVSRKREKHIAAALNTQVGRDKLGIAIVTGMFETASKPGHHQILAQCAINHFANRKVY